MFDRECGVCGRVVRFRALSINGQYVSLVCERGHHQTAYGCRRVCVRCGETTPHVENLQWKVDGGRSAWRVAEYVCCDCGARSEPEKQQDWKED